MSMEKQKRLVNILIKRTRNGELDWKTSVDESAFLVSFHGSSLQISRKPNPEMADDDYFISLINDAGDVVDEFNDIDLTSSSAPGSGWFSELKELYNLARRTALGSEKLLNQILDDLENN